MKILHLYHDLMNLYGEYANISALCRILDTNGVEYTLERQSLGFEVNLLDYDFIYVGSGTEQNQKLALSHLMEYKDDLKSYIEQGKFALFTGNSFEMLGKSISGFMGNYEGLGIFDFTTEEQNKTRNTADAIVKFEGLDDVEPLFTQGDYYVFDRCNDGDNYEDIAYIGRFRYLLNAIRNKTPVKINMKNVRGQNIYAKCLPVRLEYSEKDDKFRVVTAGWRAVSTVNLAKIKNCIRYTGEKSSFGHEKVTVYDTVTVKLRDERNALERFMLHFAHFEKQAEKLDKQNYLVRIKYDYSDQPELVIRILSFGPLVEVVGSEEFRRMVIEKLKKIDGVLRVRVIR